MKVTRDRGWRFPISPREWPASGGDATVAFERGRSRLEAVHDPLAAYGRRAVFTKLVSSSSHGAWED